MPATATLAAASATSSQVSLFLNPSPLISPAIFASFVAFRHKNAIISGCKKIMEARISRSSSPLIVCESNQPLLPSLSVGNSGPHQLHAYTTSDASGKSFSSFGASSPLFGNQDGVVRGFPTLDRRRKSLRPPKAFKNDFFRFKYPVLSEKPEWWWRTLACVPYLIALQLSYTGYFLQPFVEHYDSFGDVMYFVPGAITRLPVWFTMVYSYFVYIGIVKNKEWPHFFRFHVMMGLLLEIALQVMWTASNFFPLIHYDGKFGMYYWAGAGLAYILLLLQCIRCALAGGYAHIPFVSDAAYIHTLFNIGGYQRP